MLAIVSACLCWCLREHSRTSFLLGINVSGFEPRIATLLVKTSLGSVTEGRGKSEAPEKSIRSRVTAHDCAFFMKEESWLKPQVVFRFYCAVLC